MEYKTQVNATEGGQEITITRNFNLPVEHLFKAYEIPELFEQWMTTKLIHFDMRKHGSYAFETSHNGVVVFKANGTIHEWIPNQRITRTFEMEGSPFPVQLEYLEFEALGDQSSRLTMEIIFKSGAFRDQLLQMPFASGLNLAHNRIEQIFTTTPPNFHEQNS